MALGASSSRIRCNWQNRPNWRGQLRGRQLLQCAANTHAGRQQYTQWPKARLAARHSRSHPTFPAGHSSSTVVERPTFRVQAAVFGGVPTDGSLGGCSLARCSRSKSTPLRPAGEVRRARQSGWADGRTQAGPTAVTTSSPSLPGPATGPRRAPWLRSGDASPTSPPLVGAHTWLALQVLPRRSGPARKSLREALGRGWRISVSGAARLGAPAWQQGGDCRSAATARYGSVGQSLAV